MQFPLTIPFFFGGPLPTADANGCWIGLPTAFELKLLEPMATYPLELLRQRFMHVLTTTHDPVKSARVLFQMAFETELNTILIKQLLLPVSVPESKVCERRRFLDIDQDMKLQRYLVGPALDSMETIQAIPLPYVDFLRRYMNSAYPKYRMCTLAVAICLAKVVQ
jgi:hypothetical protein